jgi:hypothetical protein
MGTDNEADVGISSRTDTTGFEDAKKGLKETEGAAADLKSGASDLKTEFEALKTSLMEIAALAEVIAFFKDASKEAYNNEKALRGVAQAAIVFGGDVEAAKKEADTFTSALSIQSTILKTDLLDAYAKVYLATGSVTEAQKETTLAANIAAVKHLNMAMALRLVEAAATGVPGRFDRIVGGVTKGTTAVEKHNDMTRRLIGTYGDVSHVMDDAAASTDRSTRRWEQFKEQMGGPVLKAVAKFKDALAYIPAELGLMGDLARIRLEEIGAHFVALSTLMVNATENPIAAWKAYQAQRLAIEVVTDQAIRHAREDAQKWQADLDAKATVAAVSSLAFRGAGAKAAVDKSAKYELDWYGKIIKEKEKEAIAHQKFLDHLTALKDKQDEEEAKKEIELDKKLKAAKLASARAEYRDREMIAKGLLQLESDVASGGLQLAAEAFGGKKEIAMAEALINGATAVIQAMDAPWPLDLIIPVLIAAQVAEQIATISSSSSPAMPGISPASLSTAGGGFDDPAHDQAAEIGGRRWANDMIGRFTKGVSSGWAQGMAGAGAQTSNTYHYDNRRTVNVSGVGLVDASSTEMLKKLSRGLDAVSQNSLGASRIGAAPRRR